MTLYTILYCRQTLLMCCYWKLKCIVGDVNQEWKYSVNFFNRLTVLQSMKLGIDVNRHKEIIVKAISGLLLLLLKHFKLNHVYQVSLTQKSD
jgi:hypothetical protein